MKKLIKKIIDVSYKSQEGHIASSLSVLDILFTFYKRKSKDRFILSKGHSSIGLYVVLDFFGLLDDEIDDFGKFHSGLGGHPSDKLRHVEASTGSLGHGLPIGIGMALGNKINNKDENICVLIGDGEANEGTIWESALLASHHNLNNLYCIMDHNHSSDRALKIDSVSSKFAAFGWKVLEIDGHDQINIQNALSYQSMDKPVFILANTIKGKGVEMMESNPEWHHKSPTWQEYKDILADL